jgi:hypothetical protein
MQEKTPTANQIHYLLKLGYKGGFDNMSMEQASAEILKLGGKPISDKPKPQQNQGNGKPADKFDSLKWIDENLTWATDIAKAKLAENPQLDKQMQGVVAELMRERHSNLITNRVQRFKEQNIDKIKKEA